ncbi:type II secretion system F family protein [Ammoniphilus sp. CFH 90114]|uniref:type II secretion system F family protein n=1 Tax=Ammoniphilus sp. CFH 90114 TaxID=2493665 RepID=UPI00100E4B2F|nr:type II secretion system F family protein [Ammoniphilus sp. CFH 90114]RXT07831.1 pilus assembly protein TadB [Ammoniphilus sp. CFH 90114]
MSIWIYILLGLSLLSWVLAMYFFLRYHLKKIKLLKNLSLISPKKKKMSWSQELKMLLLQWSNRFSPAGKRFTLFVNEKDLERQLHLAGFPEGLTVSAFLGLRFVMLVAALLIGNVFSWLGFGGLVLLLLVSAGLFGPSLWIRWLAKRRQEQIGLDLPDFLDTMSVTLQAGAPMDAAMKQITSHMEGPLSEELIRFQQELDFGVPREEAYQRLMKRNDCPELETLVLSLLQGSKLGVPIAKTFSVMAEDMRESRIGKIKEKAGKAGPKITLITSFCILPGVILCIMGLLILNFIYNREGMGLSGWPF